MEGHGSQRRMVVNLEILEARNIVVKPDGGRESLFVRYYLSSGNGQGNNIAVNSREVMARPAPQWKQTFFLECGGIIGNVNAICQLQKQFVRFELRQRSNKVRNMFRASKVVGWVEIPWKDLLASPTVSINSWYPLMSNNAITSGGSELPPSLHLAISVKPLNSIDSVSQLPREHREDTEMYDPEIMSCRNEMRRNYVNVNVDRRIRRLEHDGCGCGGKLCCQGLHEEGNFAIAV